VSGTARAGDDHPKATVGGGTGVRDHLVGCAVCGDDADLVSDAELVECLRRGAHRRPVGVTAHDQANGGH
jgi:hypothetical protein